MLLAITLALAIMVLAAIAFVWLVGRRGAEESQDGDVDEDFARAGFTSARDED